MSKHEFCGSENLCGGTVSGREASRFRPTPPSLRRLSLRLHPVAVAVDRSEIGRIISAAARNRDDVVYLVGQTRTSGILAVIALTQI